jgi:cysteine desulfuration protein SufE
MSAVPPRRDPLDDLAALPDPQERLAWLTERGRKLAPLPASARTEAHRVPGCASRVWLVDETRAGVCHFCGDAEAPVLRGLVALVCARAEDRPASEVARDTTDVVTALQLERHLTPTRTHGLREFQNHLRRAACAHAAMDSEQ